MTGCYFAYGSNMNPARMAQRGLRVRARGAAVLSDYRLVFDKVGGEAPGAGHANVVSAAGQWVEGVLYELVSNAEILKMDPFERAPINYGRDAVQVQTAAGVRWAWTYFANPARRALALRPTRSYLDHLLAGSDHLSPAYLSQLLAIACVDDP